ncbi:MAG: galactose mutarotase [Gemmatimonadota bacterium]
MDHRIDRSDFGSAHGEPVTLYTLRNGHGLELGAMTLGGVIVSLRTPDRDGRLDDIVLGLDSAGDYLARSPHFGAITGRVANRIAGARFQLDGTTYTLARNKGRNHLHGGVRGFDKVVWDAAAFAEDGAVGVVFTRTSPDGEEGYPGSLTVRVTYALTDDDALVVDYRATTNRPTPVNLTQHSYFNLRGAGNGDILDHELMLAASAFTPTNDEQIPTGEIRPVADTPFDFRAPTPIGARIDADDVQLRYAGGYDHNYVLDGWDPDLADRILADTGSDNDAGLSRVDPKPPLAARVVEPGSGRTLEVRTTEPGVQLYTGNGLDGITGKEGRVYGPRRRPTSPRSRPSS